MWKVIVYLGLVSFVLSSVCLSTCGAKRKETRKGKSRSSTPSISTFDPEYPFSKISKSIKQNYTDLSTTDNSFEDEDPTALHFLNMDDVINVNYFSDIASFLKGILYTYPNESVEPYFIDRKSENSYTLSFTPKRTHQDEKLSPDPTKEIENVFTKLQKGITEKLSYWVVLIFYGHCLSSATKNFTTVSENILFDIIISDLMIFIERSQVIFNNYSCKEVMQINISLSRTTYEQNEPLLYDRLDSFDFNLYGRRFIFVDFTSSKFTVLERKQPQPRTRRVFPFLAYGFSVLALAFLFLSAILYSCHNYVVKKRRRVYLVTSPFVDAYEEGNKHSARDLTFPNMYNKSNPKQQPSAEVVVDEGSFLTLDFDTTSEIEEPPYKIREKSHSVQGLQNYEDSKHDSRRGSSTLSECFVKPGETAGLSEYFRGTHYYYGNLEYDLANNNEADIETTDEESSEQTTPLQAASSESLGVTRVQYVDGENGEEPSFKFETDL